MLLPTRPPPAAGIARHAGCAHETGEAPHDGGSAAAEIPADTDDPYWEFSFGGTPIFVVCNTPAHVERNSRHSPGFLITFQPRWVFEGLKEGTPRGDAARRVIRGRLRRFDQGAPSPVLGSYGDPRNREWRQCFLPDNDGDDAKGGSCPFEARTRANVLES
ncbi:MAG: YqcI/YcgG family protein [Actinophytocola sp.]|uniref:YqcI/YcgG family protein n=1 Tax=Actinophytocola sp. TaxID=1872138 RepID=UPI003C78E4F9